MSTYRTTQCPYCKNFLNFHERSEFFDYNRYIGLKYERCPHCNNIYSTGKNFYNSLSNTEKQDLKFYYICNILTSSLTFFVFIGFFVFLIASFILQEHIGDYARIIVAILAIISIILGFATAKKNYSAIKNITIDDFEIDDELKEKNVNNW